uniref:UTP--glucose-1-phosphate uridylyltransferase n=1 Tax=Syphacia muris TaxID=451379 RepID=A0A0N5ASJ3_9BILA
MRNEREVCYDMKLENLESQNKSSSATATAVKRRSSFDFNASFRAAKKKNKVFWPSLPVNEVRQQLADAIRSNPITIVVGETGSGKSTQIPKICYEENLHGTGLIAVTQPRRVAAITLAKRVSEEMSSDLGEKVAYKVRFENTESCSTGIVYGTDGILLREAIYDSLLSRYSIIIVDEAHERSLHTDILLSILKLCFEQRKNSSNPLKLLIMSATLECDLFSTYFFDAPVYGIQGRNFPVELFYGNTIDPKTDDYVFVALSTLMQLHQQEPLSSGVLIFLTGQDEIEIACKKALEASRLLNKELVVFPLYAALSPDAQMKVFEPFNSANARKVVISTNIAETSVTIPGIRIVIDSGKVKIRTFMSDRRIDVIRLEDISRASAMQRAGRAGREAPGKCYRLYSEKHYNSLEKAVVPEILRSNLATVLLELYRIGMVRINRLNLISMPPKESFDFALYQLRCLDALMDPDERGRIRLTDVGTRLAAFPVDPNYARVLVEASRLDCLEEALTVVAFMSADCIFLTSSLDRDSSQTVHQRFYCPEGDHCTMLKVYKGYRLARKERKTREWCASNLIHDRVLSTIFKIRRQLREICNKERLNLRSCGTDLIRLRKALASGLFMNACEYDRSTDSYKLVTSSTADIKIHPSSCLARSRPTAFVFSELVRTSELYARDITVIELDWVRKILNEKKKHSVICSLTEQHSLLIIGVPESFLCFQKSGYDTDVFLKLYHQFITEPATIDWSKMRPLTEAHEIDYSSLPELNAGEDQQVLQRLCVVKLNGGLGTTMGCAGPKSLITIRNGLTFLDIAIRQNEVLNKKYSSQVPLLLMNSFNTEQATKEYLEKNGKNVRSFVQSKCPRICKETHVPVLFLNGCSEAEQWYPPGHGNIFQAMSFCGLLDEMINSGREICFISNIDNTGATTDSRIAKFMLDSKIDYAMECTQKTIADTKGGTLIEINGGIMHLEIPQVPPENVEEFCSLRTFKMFNTNNIWVNLKSVKACLSQMKMEIIVNHKKLSNGKPIIQLETSVGGAIRNFDKVFSIKVPRSRFLPVKKTQDLLAIMSDVYEMDLDYNVKLKPNRPIACQPTIKLSKQFCSMAEFQRRFASIPHIMDLIRLTVDGDVTFGEDVVLKGDVIIIADEGERLEIPSKSFIENKIVKGRLRFKDN